MRRLHDQPQQAWRVTGTAAASSGAPAGTTTPPDAALIAEAARDLAEYQRLTAEGKLGEAGQRLEALKQKLERLAGSQR